MEYLNPDIATAIIIFAGVFGVLFITAVIAGLYLMWKHLFTEH